MDPRPVILRLSPFYPDARIAIGRNIKSVFPYLSFPDLQKKRGRIDRTDVKKMKNPHVSILGCVRCKLCAEYSLSNCTCPGLLCYVNDNGDIKGRPKKQKIKATLLRMCAHTTFVAMITPLSLLLLCSDLLHDSIEV